MTVRRAIIVDDERLARLELRTLLAAHTTEIAIVGEADSLKKATELLRQLEPDLVFLDVQLGRESGLDLIPSLDPETLVIFVTAFDRYAVRAFEVNALDYLLKPVAPERLARAIARLGAPASASSTTERLTYQDRLFLRLNDRMGFLAVSEIAAIIADGDCATIRLRSGELLSVSKSLGDWEQRLPEREFVRVHRSAVVNLDAVARVEEWSHRSFLLYLKGLKEPVAMSRRYAAKVRLERS